MSVGDGTIEPIVARLPPATPFTYQVTEVVTGVVELEKVTMAVKFVN